MPEKVEKVRLFVAIHPPVYVVEKATELIKHLSGLFRREKIRWIKAEQFHLTTQFLGFVPKERVLTISRAIKDVAASHQSFVLHAGTLGCFPSPSRPRVLWVGLQGDLVALQELKAGLDAALVPLGYQPESRPFHPHLTLARISELSGAGRAELRREIEDRQAFSAGEFTLATVDLMQSVLSPKGASYQLLHSAALNERANSEK